MLHKESGHVREGIWRGIHHIGSCRAMNMDIDQTRNDQETASHRLPGPVQDADSPAGADSMALIRPFSTIITESSKIRSGVIICLL